MLPVAIRSDGGALPVAVSLLSKQATAQSQYILPADWRTVTDEATVTNEAAVKAKATGQAPAWRFLTVSGRVQHRLNDHPSGAWRRSAVGISVSENSYVETGETGHAILGNGADRHRRGAERVFVVADIDNARYFAPTSDVTDRQRRRTADDGLRQRQAFGQRKRSCTGCGAAQKPPARQQRRPRPDLPCT